MHEAWPAFAWCVPAAHKEHEGWLVCALALPMAHGEHTRGVVGVGVALS